MAGVYVYTLVLGELGLVVIEKLVDMACRDGSKG